MLTGLGYEGIGEQLPDATLADKKLILKIDFHLFQRLMMWS
jgi:hypothetical protein